MDFVEVLQELGGPHQLRLPLREQPPAPPRVVPVRAFLDVVIVHVLLDVPEQLRADLVGPPVEDDDVDGHVVPKEKFADRIDRDPESLVLRVAVGAGGDEGEGHGLAAVLPRQLKGGPVTGGEQVSLPVPAVPPHRADGVDDVPAGQPVTTGDLCASRFTASQRPALLQEPRAGGAVNTPVDAAPAQQRRVGGVHDGVHLHLRDVVPDDLKRHGKRPSFASGSSVPQRAPPAGRLSPHSASAL